MYGTQGVLALIVLYMGLAHCIFWDIIVARSNRIEFYNEGTLVYTATPTAHRIKWVIYDPVRDRVLFADKHNRDYSASSFDIATNNTQTLIKKKTNRYLTRFAYDPATELLFGTVKNKIYSFSIKPGHNNEVNENLVIDLESVIPREVAVDSCGGYIYWIASNIIERALFNGSKREVIIDGNITVKKGLTIDVLKIYWIESQEYNDGTFSIESADLNGMNRRSLYIETDSDSSADKLTISKDFISWGDNIEQFFWQLPKNSSNDKDVKPNKISMSTTISCGSQDIAANYKIEERTQGITNCNALKRLLPDYYDCLNTSAIESLFCVNGTKVDGESRCDCIQGYTGERCDVSVCLNYCLQGDCSVSAEGQPKCRCSDGYTGERCNVSLCHNYCFQGDCHVIAERPKCRCNAGYSGERCEVYACHGYCLNNGVCSLNKNSEPVCHCTGQYEGEKCSDFRKGFHWRPLVDGKLPPNALIGGFENEDIYIARAYHSGSLCPGKYVKSVGNAFVAWGGGEHSKDEFEILCGYNTTWVEANSSYIPPNAFIGGRTGGPAEVGGEPLYICRAWVVGNLVCGKAYARTHLCYLPYKGGEVTTTSYEILVKPDDEKIDEILTK